jgi:O-methyltransferase / aklanonic acid methyltransferase
VGPPIFERFGKRLNELLQIDESARVLDVATGRGASLLPAAQHIDPQSFAIGIDLATAMLKEAGSEARRLRLTNIHLLQMDGEQLGFRSNSFQAILCGFAIFFFIEPQQALEEWYRVLSPSGKIGICLAGQGDERWRWYEELLVMYQGRYQFSLSPVESDLRKPEAIVALLTNAGCRETRIVNETYEFLYADEEEWWEAKWTHGARFPLEQMSKDVLSKFKAEVFERLRSYQVSDGFREKWNAIFILGKK